MNILYFGQICDEELYKAIEKKQLPYFIAQYMYEKALYDELIKNKELDIEFNSIYQTEYFPEDKIIFTRKDKNKIQYLSFINLPYLRELSYFISTCSKIGRWYLKNRNNRNKCIYLSCHFAPVSLAVILTSSILSIKKVVTFTDLALFSYSKNRVKSMKLYKKILIKPYIYLVNTLQKKYDAYVLFSEEMKYLVNSNNKPYLVIEGIFNSERLNYDAAKKANAILHAGTLDAEYGIKTILDTFALIEDPNLELWLIGKGDMSNEIQKKAETDHRIIYWGFLPRNEVFEKLKEAKLLVNFRSSNDIYTKYSFPSKMFEYMVSGTPVLTTKLQGIPSSYFQYLYVSTEESVEELKLRILEIIAKDQSELNEFGHQAAKFILQNKNPTYQVNQIYKMLHLLNLKSTN